MKKALSLIIALTLALSMFTFGASAATTDPNTVGAVGDNFTIAPGFSVDDMTQVRTLIMKEYKRGIQTKSVKHKGKAYFNYGESTGELVHAWVGSERKVEETGEIIKAAACMNQDFVGGYSDSLATLGQADNWCCILVTPESLKKGEAYTVRDGIANAWGNAGGTNSYWGLPTGNQYWIGDICYQTFERGYAAAENAQVYNVEFFAYDAGNQAPAVPNADAYDHWQEVATNEGPQTYDPPAVTPPPGGYNPIPVEPEPMNPGEDPGTEDPGTEDPDPENPDGDVTSTDEIDGEDEAEVNSNTSGKSNASGGTLKTTTYFLGMELTPELQRNLIIAGIALAVLIIAIIVVIVVLVKKKKAKAAGPDAPEAIAPEDPASEETPSEDAPAEEEPKDEENK